MHFLWCARSQEIWEPKSQSGQIWHIVANSLPPLQLLQVAMVSWCGNCPCYLVTHLCIIQRV